jgi:transposase
MITDQQYRRLLKLKQKEKSVSIAASKAGMSEKTARKYLKQDQLPSQTKKDRHWRTREDVFAKSWSIVEEFLKNDQSLQAKTLFDYLCREDEGKYQESQLRTLQRKIKRWKAVEGPPKEVMFAQVHHPGVQCQSDYTWMNSLNVTIGGQPFPHLFYHFVLSYSNWEWGQICYSESIESLKEGLQSALWRLGGVPKEHRTDNLSAAVNNLNEKKEFTANYQGILDHYGLKASRNNPGKGHENGDVEQSHFRFKTAVDQELRLRGSREFISRENYREFLNKLMIRRNGLRTKRLHEELKVLHELPARRLEDYTEEEARVSRFSTISVRNNVYSVDSRLIGEKVRVRIHSEKLIIRYGGQKIETLPRLRGAKKHQINYRHVIDSLVKKPGAFANYRYREDLFPRFMFRLAYDWIREHRPVKADREYLQLLALAAKESEEKVDMALRHQMKAGQRIDIETIREMVQRKVPCEIILVEVPAVELGVYDGLLKGVNYGS